MMQAQPRPSFASTVAPTAAPKKAAPSSQLMPDLLPVTKKSTANNNKRSATGSPTKGTPIKRKKEAPVHPRLPKVHSNAEIDDINEIKVEGAVSKVSRLGLPVDRNAIEKALAHSDAALDRYIGLLQAQRAAAIVRQQQADRQNQKVQLPPSPVASNPPLASGWRKELSPPPVMAAPPLSLMLAVDQYGRAAVAPARSPTPPPLDENDFAPRRFAPRTQVVAAELEGMGRVVLERSVLIDRLGASGAAVAEARARGAIAPPMITQTLLPPPKPSSAANLPFGFGVKSSPGPRLPLMPVSEDDLAFDRAERIAAWLNAPEEDDDESRSEPDVPTQPMVIDEMEEEPVPVHRPGAGKSTVRLARMAQTFQPTVVEPVVATPSPVKPPAAWTVAAPEPPPEDGVVDCLCHREDEEGEELVQCERCRSWFHLDCVDLVRGSLPEHWQCVRCTGGDMPMSWRSRQRSLAGTPIRDPPTFVHSALTPRVGHFTNSFLSSELALAPSPAVGRQDAKRVRMHSNAEYAPRSPSRNSISSYGARRRLQSGAFEDLLPVFDDEEERHVPAWPVHEPYEVEPPMLPGPGQLFPSTPSRYVYTASDGLSHQVTPASTVDDPRSRSSSAAGTRFSIPATPGSQELLAHFDSASSMQRYQYLPNFSPVCEQSPSISRHRRQKSSLSGGPGFIRANWATGPPPSSAGLIKAMMAGSSAETAARSDSGLGIGFEAGGELVPPIDC